MVFVLEEAELVMAFIPTKTYASNKIMMTTTIKAPKGVRIETKI
jgi:hypothetical protein